MVSLFRSTHKIQLIFGFFQFFVRKAEMSQFEIQMKYSNKIDSVEMPNDEHQVGFKISST